DEPAALDADDEIDALVLERDRQAVDRSAQAGRVLQQRRDVVEENAGFREIGDVSNLGLEIVHGHEAENPVSRPVGASASTSTSSTRAPGGPWRSARSKRSSASASPSACASTRPSSRLRIQPWIPSRAAVSRANQRKPTPWTWPVIKNLRARRTGDDSEVAGKAARRKAGRREGGNERRDPAFPLTTAACRRFRRGASRGRHTPCSSTARTPSAARSRHASCRGCTNAGGTRRNVRGARRAA